MSTPAVAPPAGEGLSEGARVVNTFIAPSKTFTDINRSARWWLPFVIMAIFSYAFVFTVDKKVGFDKVNENAIRLNERASERLDQLSPEQREQQVEIGVKITRYIAFSVPAISLVFLLLSSLILWGSYSFGAGAQVSFGKSMAVVTYSNLVGIFKPVLAIIALMAGADSDTFNMQNPAATNLAVLVDQTQHKVLYSLCSQLDIITIWTLCLVALGFTYICKVKKGTSFAIVFGWWIVTVLVAVGASAAF
ncbi:MAG TPA: YIP1 family protein [Candidatus Koribacter sp.]|jgi:hypothetical protein